MVQLLTKAGADVTIPAYVTLGDGEEAFNPIAISLFAAFNEKGDEPFSVDTLHIVQHLIHCGANTQIPGWALCGLVIKSN